MATQAGLRGFVAHLGLYLLATMAGIGANMMLAPDRLYVVFPLLIWGGAVALHCAWVMGLVGAARRNKER